MACKQVSYCDITYHEVHGMETMFFPLTKSNVLNLQSLGSGFQFRNCSEHYVRQPRPPKKDVTLLVLH